MVIWTVYLMFSGRFWTTSKKAFEKMLNFHEDRLMSSDFALVLGQFGVIFSDFALTFAKVSTYVVPLAMHAWFSNISKLNISLSS